MVTQAANCEVPGSSISELWPEWFPTSHMAMRPIAILVSRRPPTPRVTAGKVCMAFPRLFCPALTPGPWEPSCLQSMAVISLGSGLRKTGGLDTAVANFRVNPVPSPCIG